MKKILLVLLLAVGVFGAELKTQDSICKAVEVAKQKDKPIMFVITRENCKYCKILKTKTLKDKKLVDELNKNFVVVIVNYDKGDYIPASLVNVRGVPAIWFLYKNGYSMYQDAGGAPQKIDLFLEMLDGVKKRYKEISDMMKKGHK